METVKKQIWDKVLIESKRRVMSQVGLQVGYQVGFQVEAQVGRQVRSQVEAQVRRQSMYFQMKEFYYD